MSESKTFTRQELYDLVWSEPMKTLSGRFGLSDVGMAKACRKSNIPRPPRGYWAKLAAGKKVHRQALPGRGPGMSDEIRIGGSRYGYYYNQISEEEVLNSSPTPLVFDVPIEQVEEDIKKQFKKVTMPKFPERAHRLIRKLLEADEERRIKYLASRWPLDWDKPLFDEPFERRRLKVLNAIFTALEIAGMRPAIQGKEARDLSVQINDTRVQIALDNATKTPERYPRQEHWNRPRRTNDKLKLSIFKGGATSNIRQSWEDGKDGDKLERHLLEIVIAIVLSGEIQYREASQRSYEWLVQRKANAIEKIRKRKEQEEQKERERIAALEKARIDSLLSDADVMRKAEDIRQYVKDVRERYEAGGVGVSAEEIDQWAQWAEEQADRIDPLKSGRFLSSMKELQG